MECLHSGTVTKSVCLKKYTRLYLAYLLLDNIFDNHFDSYFSFRIKLVYSNTLTVDVYEEGEDVQNKCAACVKGLVSK